MQLTSLLALSLAALAARACPGDEHGHDHADHDHGSVLGAEVARAYKPAPGAYLRAAELLDLPPSACAMVAAHNDDLAAARAQGFCTAFVARPREHGPGQATDLGPEADWDFVVRDFGELATRLGC